MMCFKKPYHRPTMSDFVRGTSKRYHELMNNNQQTKVCAICGRPMRKKQGQISTSAPPIHSWYWECGNGHREEGEVWTAKQPSDQPPRGE